MTNITKTIMYLQMTALCLTAAFAGAQAAERALPFRGTIIEGVDAPPTFEFPFLFQSSFVTGHATRLGRFTSTWEVQVNVITSMSTGTVVFTAANGDTLFTTFEGQGFPTDTPDVIHILEVQTITGGTGRFAGATGSFIRQSLLNQVLGTQTENSFDGTIVIH
jgi:hypothetical protein